jgi:hypothetical protein
VSVGEVGQVVLHCHHTGDNGSPTCSAEAIVDALGLRLEDLWPNPHQTPAIKPKASRKKTWPDLRSAVDAVAYHLDLTKPPETWTYHGPCGKPIMAVARYDIPGDKTYRPFHTLPDGAWAVGDPAGLLPLYRLPELAKTPGPIFVTEGEKCVLALEGVRGVGTTSAHGAKSPEKTDWTPLAGKTVVILPDADPPGEGYAATVLRLLNRLDPRPPWVKVVRLPGLTDGEDVADWLPRVVRDRVGDEAREAACGELQALVEAAPVIDWSTIGDATGEVPRPAADASVVDDPIPIPEWPNPPEDVAYHGLAGAVVRLIDPSTEADPVGVLLQLLIGFGNALGPGVWIVADGHFHHANEYAVTVGDTSRARKGTAWRRVRPFLAHVDSGWDDNRIAKGLSSGEGLIWEIRDPIHGTDKKTGNLVITDPGVDDKRVMVVETEFGNVLRVLAREGNTLSGVLRQGWDGDDLRTMTKQSPARATKPHVSLVGHITQQELAKYLSEVEVFNGLGNRILWACVRRSKRLPFGGSVDDATLLGFGSRLAAAAELARGVGAMTWTSTGATMWESHYDVLTESRAGLWGAITSRAEAHVLKLAMIFAALDKSAEIVDTHVLAALAVWRFCDRSAAYLFGGSLGDREADAILDALRAKPNGMTRTEIRREVFHDHKSSDEVARALGLLRRFHLVRQEIIVTGGRPAERWIAAKL